MTDQDAPARRRLPARCWQDMTSSEMTGGDAGNWIVVLPVAATEQHGPHLPLGTDSMIMEGMIAHTIRRLPDTLAVSFLPVQNIGVSIEHSRYAGTLSLDPPAARAAWSAIGASLARMGVRRLVIISSHGGNMSTIQDLALELRMAHGMFVATTNWLRFGIPDGLFCKEEHSFGIHGGAIETALMLHLRPDLVRRQKIADFPSSERERAAKFRYLRAHGRHGFAWAAGDLNPHGVVGNARSATAQKGAAMLDHCTACFVEYLQEIAAADISGRAP